VPLRTQIVSLPARRILERMLKNPEKSCRPPVTAQFTPASDGHGGALIGDPPVMATADAATMAAPYAHHA
jgi:hypothetical protein